MSKFEEMSYFEINKLVHIKIGLWGAGYYDRIIGKLFPHKEPTEKDIYKAGIIADYCGSWADMGPIIELIWDDLFELVPCGGGLTKWASLSCANGPLKAAAIIYLESLGQNND